MQNKLTQAFSELLARNRGADGRRDYYGIRIENVTPEGSEVDLVLVFKSCESYCCAEAGCHLAYYDPGWWQANILRDESVFRLSPR
jgi:hypothetical protein